MPWCKRWEQNRFIACMKLLKFSVHLLIVLTPIVLFGWLLQKDLSPSGRFQVHYTVDQLSPYVERFLPDTRVQAPQNGPDGAFRLVVDEPAYASVHTPGDFDTLQATLVFQNSTQPIIELGITENDDPLQYDLEPLQNLIIDQSSWNRLERDGLVLLQRAKMYESINDFLQNPPDRSTIATYHTELDQPFRIPGYQPEDVFSTIDVSLCGYHEFVTYLKDEPLLVKADFMDMNRQSGDDPVTILVFNEQGESVAEQSVGDDGVVEATNSGSLMRSVTLIKNDLPEGVYKVILKADRDIFFRHLTTRQRYQSFVGSVYVGDEAGYTDTPTPVRLFTDSKHLSFYTYHADATPLVTIGSGSLKLPEAQTRYDYEVVDPGLVEVSAVAGDFTLTQDNLLAFNRSQFFNPYPARLSWNTNLDALGINFIIARYQSPLTDGVWTKATASFDLRKALNNNGDIKLVLSAPGVKSLQTSFALHGLDLTFVRPALSVGEIWYKMKNVIGL